MLAEGLHVVWPAGAEDVVALLAADKVPGIPRDPDTLADILLERGLAVPQREGDGVHRYWRLAPAPLARDGQVVTLSMLRLASPELVLAGAPPVPVGLANVSEAVTLEPGTETPAELSAGEGREKTGRQLGEGTPHTAATAPSTDSASAEDTGARDPAVSTAANPRAPATPDPHALSGNRQAQARTAEGITGQGTDPNDQRGDAVANATAWLRARGTGGKTLLALAGILSDDPGAWDQRIRRKGEQLVVLFPDGLADLGAAPQAGLDALAGDVLLDVNPLTPLRRVIEIDAEHGAPLTLEVSRHLLVLFDNGRAEPKQTVPTDPAPIAEPSPATDRDAESAKPADAPGNRRNPSPADPDPARTLVERIRACDQTLPGGVSRTDGWLSVNQAAVRAWARDSGVQPYVLIRTLGHLSGCRVTPDSGLAVRETP
jgi:hypothetical protein